MKNNKLKNVFLTLSIISLSMLLVIIPAIVTRYTAGQELWTSYMHEDKRIIEKDFYKSNEFEFDILRPIFYLLDSSVTNVEDSVKNYIELNTSIEWVSKINKYGEDIGYDKKIVPSKEEAKEGIQDNIKISKNELKESYKNIEFMVINTKDNSYYSNTKYKTLNEYKKNIDGYLDIEFKKTPTSVVYIKDINGKIPKNMSDGEYPITGKIYSENIEMYISLPNPKDFKYNDIIYEANDSYKQSIEIIETLIIIGITNLLVFIISTLIYKTIKKDVLKEESKGFKVIKKIPTEFWVIIILIQLFYYLALSFGGYYYDYYNIYNYAGLLALAFMANLIFVITLYLSIKIFCSYDKKLEILKNTIIYKVYKFFNNIIKNSTKKILISSKRIPLIKRIILLGIICSLGNIVLGVVLYLLFYARLVFVITLVIGIIIGIFTWYIIKKLCYLSEIIEGTEKIKNGEINYKIDIKDYDNFTVLAENINNIGQGLEKSIDNQLRSERMKSELITNVSHDLKTPLTSIINYVELIKKEENIQPEYIRDYVNVLDVKSNRLKALIEDLFEASKASSGNIELNMENLEIRQLLRQSIGEMEEKLSNTNLDIKLKIPEEKMYIYADGKRMYRVFENLLSNISKYSLPNTRVYIDLEKNNENIRLTMKNISSYELNFDPNEITERFKRADESRNTEGSGLGLAIAKDLVNIQGGNFDIEIDGDLFKVSLEFKETEK